MLFKLLMIGGLFYILYRLVITPAINPPAKNSRLRNEMEQEQDENDGEYIDYEEVD